MRTAPRESGLPTARRPTGGGRPNPRGSPGARQMIAVLGGLGAAVAFATATLCSSRSSRLIGPAPVVAWVMLVGLAVVAVPVTRAGVPAGLDGASTGWLALAGLGNVVGLLLAYAGLR